MSREIIKHRTRAILNIDQAKKAELERWLLTEITDAISARNVWESEMRELLRLYEGVSSNPVKNFPIENAPNTEITVGAIAADSLFAQVIDLIFSTSPLVTCRPIPKFKEDTEALADAKAMQRFVNWIATTEQKLKPPVEEHCLDNIQLGTGVYYVPMIHRVKKTKVSKIVTRKPKILCHPIEDVIVTGGSYDDPEDVRVLALRFWLTEGQLKLRAKKNDWDLEHASPAGEVDWVRQRREALGRQMGAISRKGAIYEIYDTYCHFDIDNDGIEEELYVVFDRTGQSALKIQYNPYDRLPIEKSVYQRRAHLFYGLGVLGMIKPYQHELTDIHNYQTLNMLLANTRMWVGKEGVIPDEMQIWPNKVVLTPNPSEDLHAIPMADVYNSIFQAQMMIVQLAEKRVGVNELSNPRAGSVMGNRTPGITALSLLQQINKRFTSAFDGMRDATAAALRQCLYRYQEELLAGNDWCPVHIMNVIGHEDGERVIRVLRNDDFDEHMEMELTASSASINKEADRQNVMMLMQTLSAYYQSIIQYVSISANPQTPAEIRSAIRKIIMGMTEMMDKALRTFDQVRDPAMFLIDVNDELDQSRLDQEQLTNLLLTLGEQMGAPVGGEGQQLPLPVA